MPPSPSSCRPACRADVQHNKHQCVLNIPLRALQRGACSTGAAAQLQQHAGSSSCPLCRTPGAAEGELAPHDCCSCGPMPAATRMHLLMTCTVCERQRSGQEGSQVCPVHTAQCSAGSHITWAAKFFAVQPLHPCQANMFCSSPAAVSCLCARTAASAVCTSATSTQPAQQGTRNTADLAHTL